MHLDCERAQISGREYGEEKHEWTRMDANLRVKLGGPSAPMTTRLSAGQALRTGV